MEADVGLPDDQFRRKQSVAGCATSSSTVSYWRPRLDLARAGPPPLPAHTISEKKKKSVVHALSSSASGPGPGPPRRARVPPEPPPVRVETQIWLEWKAELARMAPSCRMIL